MEVRMCFAAVLLQLVFGAGATLPGARVALSQAGLNYAGDRGVDTFVENLRQYSGPNTTVRTSGIQCSVDGLHMTSVGAPTSRITTHSGGQLQWQLTGLSVSMKAIVAVKTLGIWSLTDKGTLVVSLTGLTVRLNVSIGADEGEPSISAYGCHSTYSDVSISVTGAKLEFLYNMMIASSKTEIAQSVMQAICPSAITTINTTVAQEIAAIKLNVPLGIGKLYLDYSLISDPLTSASHVTFDLKGEVYWDGPSPRSKIKPHKLPDVPPSQAKMATFSMSEYVLDTLSEATYTNNLLDYTLDRNVLPKYKSYMFDCTCPRKMCLGNWFPKLAKAYPSGSIIMTCSPLAMPLLTISSDDVTGVFLNTVAYHVLLPNNTRVYGFTTTVNATFVLTLDLVNTMITAEIDDYNANVKLTDSAIGDISDATLTQVFNMVSNNAIIPMINEGFGKGLHLPSIGNCQYLNPTLSIVKGGVVISTDLVYVPSLPTTASGT